MKNLLLLFLVNFFFLSLSAQTEQGNYLIGGSGNGHYKKWYGGAIYLQLTPRTGKFISDNLAFTVDLPLSYDKWLSSSRFSGGILPGIQLFVPLSNKLYLTPQLRAGYEFTTTNYRRVDFPIRQDHKILLEAGAGAAFFMSQSTALSIDIPYKANLLVNDDIDYGEFNLRIGILVSIPPKNQKEKDE